MHRTDVPQQPLPIRADGLANIALHPATEYLSRVTSGTLWSVSGDVARSTSGLTGSTTVDVTSTIVSADPSSVVW